MAVYKDKQRNTWYFRTRDRLKKEITRRGFKTKREAMIAEADYLKFKNNSTLNVDFKTLALEYLKDYEKGKKQRSIEKTKSIISLHILPYFESFSISKIHQRDVEHWKRNIEQKKMSKSHSQKCYSVLKSILDYAMKFYDLEKNPATIAGTIKMFETKAPFTFWEKDEFDIFLSVFDISKEKEFENFVIFNMFFYTGIRAGELLALQWSDLNEKKQTLFINKAISRGKLTTTKTKNSNRVIFISNSLMKLLLELKNCKLQLYGFSDSFFIFSDTCPLSKSTLDKRWKRYLNKSNVKPIKLHDLRHSHASHLFSLNINPLYISKRLGHKDLTVTLQIYVHIAQNIIDENDEKIKSLF